MLRTSGARRRRARICNFGSPSSGGVPLVDFDNRIRGACAFAGQADEFLDLRLAPGLFGNLPIEPRMRAQAFGKLL